MPVISKFSGIVIRMLFIQPFGAHFHAIYGDNELMVGLDPIRIIQGSAPPRVRWMVLQWAVEHQEELLADWKRLALARKPLTA